jgi:prepilin-type processing-associated H-X9-DG protein
VLYATEGGAWVQTWIRVPREAYVLARNKARQATLTSNMKQVGLAVMMYAQDNRERLPQAGEDLEGLLMPYAKNRGIFEGLVYTYTGGPLNSITDPGKTPLGYVPGPNGRATFFADGHVEWQPDP